tara:strand:- start:332 stop:514 length:183 start_codon:yes stop_codon:yes gene_type:complete
MMTQAEFYHLLLEELNDMQDYKLCSMDVVDTVFSYIDDYVEQEVIKRLDEIDDTFKEIKL